MVREKISDPAYSGWYHLTSNFSISLDSSMGLGRFLPYKGGLHEKYANHPCQEKQGCSTLFHDEASSP